MRSRRSTATLLLALGVIAPTALQAQRGNNDDNRILFEWSGRVDREATFTMQGTLVSVSGAMEGGNRVPARASVPRDDGQVRVQVSEGRGRVTVIEQPTRQNGYRVRVRISDNAGGAAYYRISTIWERGFGNNDQGGGDGWNNNNNNAERDLFVWRGTVDREVRLTMQGNQITRAGDNVGPIRPPSMGNLPRRDGMVEIITDQGRGIVDVLEQPSRQNGYRTIVRIRDTQGGSSNYRITARWVPADGGNNMGNQNPDRYPDRPNNDYNQTRLRWSGYVDGLIEIRINGDRVQHFTRNGQPVQNVRFFFTGMGLDRFEGQQVQILSKNGRGAALVVQQPSASNNYTAIIRVNDNQSGASNYSLEISW